MKLWLLALVPSVVLAFSPTKQQDCSPIDLRNETLGTVRNQKDVAWCYAFSAADMLAHTFENETRISAADVAIAYNETKFGKLMRWVDLNIISRKVPGLNRMPHQTGFNKVALMKAMSEGWCPESVFPSEAWTKYSRSSEGWVEEQVPLASAMLDIAALHDVKKNLSVDNLPYYFGFKNVGPSEFIQLLQTKNIAQFYYGLRKAACRDDRQPFNYSWKVKMVIKHPGIFKRVSEQLEVGRLVGLDYDSRLLLDNTNRGLKISELHTSPIVGRRWNQEKNSCEFLIRNSYGESCGERYDVTHDCQDGNLWLGELQIYRNMSSIVYMLSGHAK